jgi:predicted GTPase
MYETFSGGAMKRKKVLILGAAGRDFHNFDVFFKDDAAFEVVGFTATQIPGIESRAYPAELSGALYPEGLPIFEEDELETLIAERGIDVVVLSYSDLSYATVMHLASRSLAAGADYWLMGGSSTMIPSTKPVIAVCAVRTGCGKSQVSRHVAQMLRQRGLKTVAIRHPMPYGDLAKQRVQRLATNEDLATHDCTIEEREEYEAHISRGTVVYAGVLYQEILAQAQEEADVVIWDGGNNDLPFIKPDLWIVVADPLRPGHEMSYYPGEANFRAADVIVINKVNNAPEEAIASIEANAKAANPKAKVVRAFSEVTTADPSLLKGKRALVIEDGPTLTHGGMAYGAGKVAAEKFGAIVVDPRPFAKGSIAELYTKFPHLGDIIPAMGYYPEQVAELEETINEADCDVVLVATPFDLGRLLKVEKPLARVAYEHRDAGEPSLTGVVEAFLDGLSKG